MNYKDFPAVNLEQACERVLLKIPRSKRRIFGMLQPLINEANGLKQMISRLKLKSAAVQIELGVYSR